MILLKNEYFSIITILTFFSIFWIIYNAFIRPPDSNKDLLGEFVLNIDNKYQKFFPCCAKSYKSKIKYEKGIDLWSMIHIFIYFISGLIIPNEYEFVIIISILCEITEYLIGYRGRLSDLFFNLLGYYIGSNIHISTLRKYGKFLNNNKDIIVYSVPILFIILYLMARVRKKIWD